VKDTALLQNGDEFDQRRHDRRGCGGAISRHLCQLGGDTLGIISGFKSEKDMRHTQILNSQKRWRFADGPKQDASARTAVVELRASGRWSRKRD